MVGCDVVCVCNVWDDCVCGWCVVVCVVVFLCGDVDVDVDLFCWFCVVVCVCWLCVLCVDDDVCVCCFVGDCVYL